MKEVVKILTDMRMHVEELLESSADDWGEVLRIRGKMGDCQLPEKIKLRNIELKMLFDKIMKVEEQY